ncbi:MAG: hypothetical protein JWR09_1137 [Mucilaginibacter sp.]|nr:hypothetical protein [Mucilaginibacter sp.]
MYGCANIHVDGSVCLNKRSMPSKANIARYWKDEKCYKLLNYIMDWGEPSCWACGKWIESYDSDPNELEDVFSIWNDHPYLERCHIVPKMHGGCNCEANLVLLCRDCHKASPDSKDPNLFIKWVFNRKSHFHYVSVEFKEALEVLEYEPKEEDCELFISEEFKEFYFQSAVFVGGKISMATRVACFIEYKKFKGIQ